MFNSPLYVPSWWIQRNLRKASPTWTPLPVWSLHSKRLSLTQALQANLFTHAEPGNEEQRVLFELLPNLAMSHLFCWLNGAWKLPTVFAMNGSSQRLATECVVWMFHYKLITSTQQIPNPFSKLNGMIMIVFGDFNALRARLLWILNSSSERGKFHP